MGSIELLLITLFIIILIYIRIRIRGYFWKDKKGKKLKFKQFLARFKSGVEGITPLQQTRTQLISFIPIIGGTLWGIGITLVGKTYWLMCILIGSLPIQTISVIGTLQKYWKQKKIEETFKEIKWK